MNAGVSPDHMRLLKEHKVPLHYTEADLEEDLAAHRNLGLLSGR